MSHISSGESFVSGYGGYNSSDVDFGSSNFAFKYTATDKALAIFRITFGCCYIIIGTYALVRFYRSRWVLDIRTRSAYLVMLSGFAVLLSMMVTINISVPVVFDVTELDWFWNSLALHFLMPLLFGSYICRAMRLAVVFHPRAKRALPWLIPERNHVVLLLIGSVAFLAIPITHHFTMDPWEIIPQETGVLAWVSVGFAVALGLLYPFIRKVDDLFKISTELAIVTVAVAVMATVEKLVHDSDHLTLKRWLGGHNTQLFSATVFGVSIIDPLRRLAFDPLAPTKANYANKVLLSRRESSSRNSSTGKTESEVSPVNGDDDVAGVMLEEGKTWEPPASTGGGGGGGDGSTAVGFVGAATSANATAVASPAAVIPISKRSPRSGGAHQKVKVLKGVKGDGLDLDDDEADMEVWDFERIARTPMLAAAFEDFSRKALCHESVLFLAEVARYQQDDFTHRGPSATSTTSPPSQFSTFCYIIDTFIKIGSTEEVNISAKDKRKILDLYRKGEDFFEGIAEDDRRMIFMRAYVEVRQMLEANLLRRFLITESFKRVRVQRENMQAMMGSPRHVRVAAV